MQQEGIDLEVSVNQWIEDNEEKLLEIIDISYESYGPLNIATITYEERE